MDDIQYYQQEIITDIEIWRELLETVKEEDPSYFKTLVADYNTYNGYFAYFKRPSL